MRTRTEITLTAAGLVLRALGIAEHMGDHWARVTVNEHMRDAMTDLEPLR